MYRVYDFIYRLALKPLKPVLNLMLTIVHVLFSVFKCHFELLPVLGLPNGHFSLLFYYLQVKHVFGLNFLVEFCNTEEVYVFVKTARPAPGGSGSSFGEPTAAAHLLHVDPHPSLHDAWPQPAVSTDQLPLGSAGSLHSPPASAARIQPLAHGTCTSGEDTVPVLPA